MAFCHYGIKRDAVKCEILWFLAMPITQHHIMQNKILNYNSKRRYYVSSDGRRPNNKWRKIL